MRFLPLLRQAQYDTQELVTQRYLQSYQEPQSLF